MKPKEWLLENGHITEITRGRMSLANIALIENAVRSGVAIEGYAVSTAEPKTETEKSAPKVEKVAVDPNRVFDVPDETRPEAQWEAYTYVDGEKHHVGMRTCCNVCKNSLTYCHCRSPIVNVDSERTGMVNFGVRTKPLPTKRF